MTSGEPPQAHPLYLELGDVLDLCGQIFHCKLDEAADQLCDRAGLAAALAGPATHAHYQNADLAMQAAVLARGIAEGQCFIDGNKRNRTRGDAYVPLVNGFDVRVSQLWLGGMRAPSLERSPIFVNLISRIFTNRSRWC